MTRRLPWWLVVAVGTVCVALGGVLTAAPFRSLVVLAWLAAAALAATGLAELVSSPAAGRPWLAWLAAAAWILGAVVAVAWPGRTIHALALALGVSLVLGGAGKLGAAVLGTGDERILLGLSGLTNVGVGILALSWPALTVLALAVLFGVRTMLFGFGQIALGLRLRRTPRADLWAESRRWPPFVRWAGTVAALALALGGMGVSVAVGRAHPAAPGPFYTAPSLLPPGPPGTLIPSEVIEGFHSGAIAYRVLYKSTGHDGRPTAVSGFVVAPDGPSPAGGRPVVAYTHGTVGVAPNCAPSLVSGPKQPLFYEGGAALLAAGYVIAASDYQGLGTAGPHPYLVGASEAMNELDAVRAARRLPVHASADVAVWGHSQGGHAALFTGQLASSYAPELHVVGVAAGAPVPNLLDLFKLNLETTVGKILIAMALQSWEGVYHDAGLDRIVAPSARPAVAKIARHCLYDQKQILASVPSALVLGLTFLRAPPWELEPWRTIAHENNPGQGRTTAPLLIVQGGGDHIVDPEVTKTFVRTLCGEGDTVALRLLPGVGHLETGHDAASAVVAWIADRFAGKQAPTTCG